MTVQGLGTCSLTALMRADRNRDADSSWLLFGPSEEPFAERHEEESEPAPWKYAAE